MAISILSHYYTLRVLKHFIRQDFQLSSPKDDKHLEGSTSFKEVWKSPELVFYNSEHTKALMCCKGAFWFLKCCFHMILSPSSQSVSNKSITGLYSLKFWSLKNVFKTQSSASTSLNDLIPGHQLTPSEGSCNCPCWMAGNGLLNTQKSS